MLQPASVPITKDLVLIGGGHSHAIALRLLGMSPIPGVRLTLISETSNTPYSGMLPGHLAGLYSYEECHIDLRPLAQFAQAQFYLDRAIALDLANQRVICAKHPAVAFDLLSIDIGSIPTLPGVPGATTYSIPVKPWRQFLARWEELIQQVQQHPERQWQLGVVGGGAGGVELALAVQHRLWQILRAAGQPLSHLQIHLFHRGAEVMTGHHPWVRQRFRQILQQRDIQLHLRQRVCGVTDRWVECESGLKVACDRLFWVTQASAPDWPRESGLATDPRGFIQVGETLQSLSHPFIFAAGDIAAMVQHSRPKAGVFAVRQGKPLVENLRRSIQGHPLLPYRPQKKFLSLVSTGNPKAMISWGNLPLTWESPLIWRWKDWIDRRFMEQFRNLPPMPGTPSRTQTASARELDASGGFVVPGMPCAGCGSKVGSAVLEQVLVRIRQDAPWPQRQDILLGLDTPDDAAVVRVPPDQVMVHTLDYFPALVNDPFVFGQITAQHCLSDIFAMGATPQNALAIATLPYGSATKLTETLYQLLSGAVQVLNLAQAPLVGGHTTEGQELALGLACNGLVHPNRLLRKQGLQPGQVLILNKPLGTGTLFAAQMRLQAQGQWIDAAIESMLLSNQAAAHCLIEHQATACTDITGFGLLGHLWEMVRASQVAVELDLEALPILDGAITTLQRGIVSSLHPQNLQVSAQIRDRPQLEHHPHFRLLFDPQTSGGLLAAVPEAEAIACLSALKNAGYANSRLIGRVVASDRSTQPFILKHHSSFSR